MPGPLRPALAGLVALVCGGCVFESFSYTVDRYGSVRPVNVRLGCRDTYEVWDRRDLGSLLVITNVVNEVLVCGDGGLPPLAERQRQVAEVYLTETSNRPACRLTGETRVSEIHREFTYRCPPSVPLGRGLAAKG